MTDAEAASPASVTDVAAPPPVPSDLDAPASVRPKRGRRLGLMAVAVILGLAQVLAVILIARAVWPQSPVRLTMNGRPIADPTGVLRQDEATTAELVAQHHGVATKPIRCFFSQATQGHSDFGPDEVLSFVYCGPVLFVDSTPGSEYVSFRISGPDGANPVPITSGPPTLFTNKVEDSIRLVRPDRRRPVPASGAVAPAPLMAAPNTVSVVEKSLPLPRTLSQGVTMSNGANDQLTVDRFGPVPRFGVQDQARAAPAGYQIVTAGVTTTTAFSGNGLSVVVDGRASAVNLAAGFSGFIAAVVPSNVHAVDLSWRALGLDQRVSMLTGVAGTNVPTLYQRTRFSQDQNVNGTIGFGYRDGSRATAPVKVGRAQLDFSYDGEPSLRPIAANQALLSVETSYTIDGHEYGLPSALLNLRLPNGTVVSALNVDDDTGKNGLISNAFVVPATFTTGTVTVSGTLWPGTDHEVDVTAPFTFKVEIANG